MSGRLENFLSLGVKEAADERVACHLNLHIPVTPRMTHLEQEAHWSPLTYSGIFSFSLGFIPILLKP